MSKFKTYQAPDTILGVTDLKSLSPWDDSSFGWGDYLWDKICDENDKEAIEAEKYSRRLWNENYINQLKRSGKFGTKEEGHTITIQCDPFFDDYITLPKEDNEDEWDILL